MLCGRTIARALHRKRGFTIVQCQCGLVYTNPRLDPEELGRLYSDPSYFSAPTDDIGYADYDSTGDLRRRTFARWLREIGQCFRRPGRLLDIGCATGLFLEVARERGWEVTGLELSTFAAEKARAKGFRVLGTAASEASWGEQRFELVTLFDVIEHLPNPSAELAVIRGLLAPGGLLAIVTPNIASLHARVAGKAWFLLKPEEHLYYFAPATLRRILERGGFEVVRWHSSGQYQSLDFLGRRVEGYVRPLGAAARRVLRLFGVSGKAVYMDASCFFMLARAA